MRKVLYIIGVLVCLFVVPASGSAHVTGQSYEQVFGEYKIDVGYDPYPFVAGESVRFDFNVVREADGIQVAFADVWVRIAQGNNVVFASGIHRPQLGKTGMTFTFPKDGDYTISTRFENPGQTIVEAQFPVTVEQSGDAIQRAAKLRKANMWAGISWGVTGAVVVLFMILKRRKRRN